MHIYYGDKRDWKNLKSSSYLQVNSCGSATTLDSEYLVVRSGRKDYHLFFVTEGEAEIYETDGRVTRLSKGDFVLYPPKVPQKYKRLRGSKDFWVHFNGFQVPEILNDAALCLGVSRAEACAEVNALFLSLITENSTHVSGRKGAEKVILLNILYTLGNICAHQDYRFQNSAVSSAISYINENYEKDFSNTFLANMCHLSLGRFEHIFRAEMGISPSAYRQSLRIDNAKNLLSSTELPISEVGILCGFSDSLYFSRIFRQKTGCSPTEYRRKSEE